MSVTIDPHGKPVLTEAACFFNISHTKNIAVCAVSDMEVGIDVEHKRELKDPLIRRAFTPEEIAYAEKLDEDESLTYYTRLWTIKESVMKWYGLGLALPPEDIEVKPVIAGSFGMEGVTSEPSFIYGNSGADVAVSVKNHGDCDRLNFTFFSHKDCCITVCSEYENFTAGMEWIRIPGGQYGKN